jgi:filamentous hemagglutinin family protein
MWRQAAVSVAIACVFAAGKAQANGTAPTVVSGQAKFATTGNSLNITNSPGAIINWQGFSIGVGETTRFIQQSAASSVLNRVIGSDPSVILGTLISNGRVFLINPSGILVGQGARIDVAGLVASTLDLSNQDFLAGRLNFASNPLAGKVENQGSITTPSGGSVYLVGTNVTNSGIINSPQGDVILAAGQSVNIFDSSTPGVRVEITASDNAAVNLGKILAHSGEIGIYGAALQNAGIINANQVGRDASGKIVLRATQDVTLESSSRISANGGQAGTITVQSETGDTLVSGVIEAKGTGAAGKGGTVQLLGNRVGLIAASVNASGTVGGGTVLVGGDLHGANSAVQNASATYLSADSTITADAITNGSGGKVVLWANDSTRAYGSITARGGVQSGDGGLIETSGHWLDVSGIDVNAGAPNGKSGTWLLDPADVTITSSTANGTFSGGDPNVFSPDNGMSTSTVNVSTIVTSLNAGTDVTITTANTGGSGNGDITVGAAVTWTPLSTTPATLTLSAIRDVNVNAAITSTNGSFVSTAARDVNVNAAVTTTNGSFIANAGNNVNVTAAITITTGNLVLSAGNNGIGPTGSGVTGGSAIFAAPGTVTLNTGASASIYYNPSSYATPTNYTSDFTGVGTVNSYMWVFAQANNKVYNGTTTASLSFVGDPTLGGIVTLVPGTADFDTRNAGNGKTVTYSGYSLGGLDANKFALFSSGGTTTANITPAPVTLTAPVVSKIYDGGTAYTTIAGDLIALSVPLIAGDTVTAATLAYLNKNAGAGDKTVNLNTVTINDSNGGANYTVTLAGNSISTITPAALALNAATDNRAYNGGISSAGVVAYTGLQTGDTLSGLSQDYASKNVLGVNLSTLNVNGGYTLSDGNSGGNYTATLNSTVGTITPAALALNAATDNRIYNGGINSAGTVTYTGLQTGDTLTGLSQAYASKNVLGANLSTLNVNGGYTLSDGNSGANYTVLLNSTAGTITPAAIAINAASDSRTYNGGISSAGTVTYTGLQTGDTLTGLSQDYASKNVLGTNLSTLNVNAGYTLSDGNPTPGANYTVTLNNAAGTITPAAIAINAATDSRTYNGGISSAGVVTYTGLQTGDTLTGLSQAYASKNALGANLSTLNVNGGYTLSDGNSGGNYTVTLNSTVGTITPAALAINAVTDSRVYNGGISSTGGVAYNGLQTGDTLTGLSQDYASKNVLGTNLSTLNVNGGYTLSDGNSGGNYTVTLNSTAGTITPAALALNAATDSRTYNGGIGSAGVVTYTGLQTGDTLSGLSQVFASKNVMGANLSTLNVNGGYTLSDGNSGANYAVTLNSAAGTITKAILDITANALGKVYGATAPALTYSTSGFQLGDTAGTVLSGALSRTAGENTGNYAINQNTLASNANYSITYTGANFGITPAALNVAANSQSKVFGASDPALTFSVTGLVNNPALGIADIAGTVLSGALTRVSGETVLGGPYAITQGSLVANSNYTLGFTHNYLIITGAAAEPILGTSAGTTAMPIMDFNAGQVIFTGVINNEFYYRPGNFWHISLNADNADPGFDVMRGTNDLDSRLDNCDGGFCETWSFPQEFEKTDGK